MMVNSGVVYLNSEGGLSKYTFRLLNDSAEVLDANPAGETSDSTEITGNILIVLILILMPALLLISSSNFNSFTARNIEKISKNQVKGSTIRNIHYGNWDVKKQDIAIDFGTGFLNLIMASIYGLIVATGYIMIGILYALFYLVAAYLIVAGIFLLFTVGAVGLICFIPFLFLMPFLG